MAHINFVHSFEDFLSLPPDTKDMEFNSGKHDNDAWKLHIFLDQKKTTVSDPIIRDTAKFLMDSHISFKMGNGGDGGKVFTVYIGEYDEARRVATQINEHFGEKYKKNFPQGGSQLQEDMLIFNNIGMRFEGVVDNWYKQNEDSLFSNYGCSGIPSINRKIKINKTNDWKMSALACHIFLAENCGSKYLGSDYEKNPWANKFFKDLSDKYTYQEISDYVSSALDLLKKTNQRRFIRDKNLVHPSQGIMLSVNDIIPSFPQSDTLNKTISAKVRGLEVMPEANNITIYKNKFGNDILEYKQDDKLLASCSLNGDEHLVRLYADNGTFQEYMTASNGRAKQIRGNTLYPVTGSSLACKINNIASLSKVLGARYLKAEKANGTFSPTNYTRSSQER